MYLKLIFNLIKLNPAKITYIIIIGLSIFASTKFKGYENYQRIIKSFEWENKFVYVVEANSTLSIDKFDEPQKVDKGYLITKENPGKIVSYIALIASSVFLGITFFLILVGEDDVNWDFKKSLVNTYFDYVRCDVENNNYFYHLRGKLLTESNYKLNSHQIKSSLYEFIGSENLYPNYEGTTQERRDKILDKILKK